MRCADMQCDRHEAGQILPTPQQAMRLIHAEGDPGDSSGGRLHLPFPLGVSQWDGLQALGHGVCV